MKLLPYINFAGNCKQAIAFYEKVFAREALTMTYQDAEQFDPNYKAEEGKENWVMHSSLKISKDVEIQFSDCLDNGKNVGTNVCLQLTYKTAEEVEAIYHSLKEGGRIICELQPTFYSPLYVELVDVFGIRWVVMQEYPEQ